MTKLTFTPSVLDALKVGTISDPRTPGMFLEAKETRGRVVRTWKYRRRITGKPQAIKATLGAYPTYSIADAREWGGKLNDSVERGIDPKEAERIEKAANITVADAHALYMADAKSGTRKVLKPRTLKDKADIWRCDIEQQLGNRVLQTVTDDDLWALVLEKGETAGTRANRLAAEAKVFMKWCCSRAGKQAGVILKNDPAAHLDAHHFPSAPRARFLSHEELGWLLSALVGEGEVYRRAILLMLLTGCRKEEALGAPTSEIVDDVWTISSSRTKNSLSHRMPLGPWATSLCRVSGDWLVPSSRKDGPMLDGWYKVLARVTKHMEKIAERPIEHWTYHDLRRTMRSNTKRLGIDFETAEAMINHKKKGLEAVYDGYDLFDEKREGYAKWEAFIVSLAVKARIAEALSIPGAAKPSGASKRAPQAIPQLQPA